MNDDEVPNEPNELVPRYSLFERSNAWILGHFAFACVREIETARHAEAEDFVFLCQMGITPDLTLEENNVAH